MLTLTLWNSAETTQHTIELYQHAPVNLNYQFTDVTNINKAVGSYSQTFRVPATKANTDFFGDIKNPAVNTTSGLIEGRYSVKRKIRAALSYNSIPMMTGYVQIKAIYQQKKDFADIELVFFGDTVDMAAKIGDKMLSDIADSSLNHVLNKSNIVNSWAGSSAVPFDGSVRYGLLDKGQNWQAIAGSNTSAASPVWSNTDGVYQGYLTPYVRAKYLVNTILSEAGFTYTSNFIDGSDFANVYLPAYFGSETPRSTDFEPENQLAAVGLAANVTTTSIAVLPLLDTVSNAYDYGGNWDNSTYQYTSPYINETTFTLNTSATPHSSGLEYVIFKVWKIPSGSVVGQQQLTFSGTGQHTFTFFLLGGDKIYVTAQKASNAPGGTYEAFGSGVDGSGTWLRIDNVTEPLHGQTVDMSKNYPEIKQIDFLMGLQSMFNLVFVPDKNKPNHILIEPFNDYVSSGTAKDWTNKIDYTKDVVVKPTVDLQKKQYDWTHSEGQDFVNVLIQQQTGRVYGRYRVTDPQNDFASGEASIQSPFAPYLMTHIPNTNFVIHRCITNDGSAVGTPKPRLAFWCGQSTLMGAFYIREDNGTTDSTAYNFPVFSNYNSESPTITDENLNFGYERDFFFVQVHPLNTLYYKYWSPYVNELYTQNARHITAFFKLTRADIQDFEFSDKIYIQDTYYRILKISNFDATKEGITKVELLKVGTDVADCADIPHGIKENGQIVFNNNNFDYGSEECCVRYGYTWRKKLGRCYPAGSQAIPPSVT